MHKRKFHFMSEELIRERGQALADAHSIPHQIGMAAYVACTNMAALIIHFDQIDRDPLRVASMRDAFGIVWSLLDEGFNAEGRIERAVIDGFEMAFVDAATIKPDAAKVIEFLEREGMKFEPLKDKDGKPIIN